MSSWLAPLTATHIPTMTNADSSTMEGQESANQSRDSPEYIRDMFNTEANLLHPHLQGNASLLADTSRTPSPRAPYNVNGVTVSLRL